MADLSPQKLQPVTPHYFSVIQSVSWRPKPRTIPLSRIDPLQKGRRKSKNSRNGGSGDERTNPTAVIEGVEHAETYMGVYRGKGDRFVVISEHREIYAAYVALNRTDAKCVVYEPEASTRATPQRRRPRTSLLEKECEVIRQVCQASMELCDLLEAEAFAEAQSVGTPIERLRIESGLSYQQLADHLGLQKNTVIANAKGRTAPRPETLKLYADEFSCQLRRQVTVAEIQGKLDA